MPPAPLRTAVRCPGVLRAGRASGQPGALPAVHPAVPDRRADPGDRPRLRRGPRRRGVLPDVRAGQDRAARAGRPAGDRPPVRASTPSTATASPARTTSSATSTWSPTRPPRWRWPPGCGTRPELAGAAHGALVKLRAAGVEVDDDRGRVQPRVAATEPAFAPLLAAVQAGRAVGFEHRRGGPAASWPGGPSSRGAWCPGGAAGTWSGTTGTGTRPARSGCPGSASRSRRSAGRARCSVPDGVDLMAMVRHSVGLPPVTGKARVWVADGHAHGPAPARPDGRPPDARRRAGDELELELRSAETVARLAGRARPGRRGAVPGDLAEAVRANWAAAAAAHAPRVEHAVRT